MTSGRRDRLLLRFRNLASKERGLLSNALGRAIRKAPDKKIGTIVLPVFISAAENPEHALDESPFKHVWDVLKALRPRFHLWR